MKIAGNTQLNLEQGSHASEEHHVSHEITLGAEKVFDIGGVSITNSLLNTWIVVFFLIVVGVVLRKNLAKVPKGIQNFFEIIVEGGVKLCDSVTNDRQKSLKIFPFAFTFFIIILLNNWLGFFPGVGSVGFILEEGGHKSFIPYFRGGTADLNTTLALALISVIFSNIFGAMAVGFYKHLNKYINIHGIVEIPKKIFKDPTVLIVNPIKFFVGVVEIVGEVAKVASLSFRLFGNIFAGEVLLSSIAVLFAFGLPIPFMFLEVLVGFIQALIFGMLTLVYFTIAMTDEEH